MDNIPNYHNAFPTIPILSPSPSASPHRAAPSLTDTPGIGMTPGGTLIVCPMTLISQWVEELRSKVLPATGMTVMMYYGAGTAAVIILIVFLYPFFPDFSPLFLDFYLFFFLSF